MKAKAGMKVFKFDDEVGREAWLNWRLGKITGSRLKDIYSKTGGIKIGEYALIAESFLGAAALAEDENDESDMNRGTRLEKEAVEMFRKETGKKVDDSLIGWERADDSRIAISPDGIVGKYAALEAKCLSAPRHVEARVTGKIPKDYELQVLQYFIVNDDLKTLYFIFYDPRFPRGLDFFFFEIHRKDKKAEIEEILRCERESLVRVRYWVNDLTKFIKV